MELGVLKKNGIVPVVATHTSGPDDLTPLQLISADLLAYYRSIEAEYFKLQAVTASTFTSP